jgi:hypothetical protein
MAEAKDSHPYPKPGKGSTERPADRTIRAVPRKYRKYVVFAAVACCLIAFCVSVAFNCAYAVAMGQTQFHHVVYCSLALLVSLAMLLATHALVLLPGMSAGHKFAMQALRAFAFAGALYFGTGFASMTKDVAVGEARTKIQMRDKVSGVSPAPSAPQGVQQGASRRAPR